jgi:hypothetical protein
MHMCFDTGGIGTTIRQRVVASGCETRLEQGPLPALRATLSGGEGKEKWNV